MTKTRFEKPQSHNPHRLTINQHVFPHRSIARFANATGTVWLRDLNRKITRPAKPDDAIFCAMRVWDERAESGYMKGIEDAFQALAEKIIAGAVTVIGDHHDTINEFFALWYLRARSKDGDHAEVQIKGVMGDALTKDQEEILEKKGMMFIRQGGIVPARQINGMQLQRYIDFYSEQWKAGRWGIVEAQSGEFVVPDVPTHMLIPLTPTLSVVYASLSGKIDVHNLAKINRDLMIASREYFFAHDFSNCPK